MVARAPIRLNGVELPPAMIAAESQHHPARTPAAAFADAARALIVRTLLLEEARRRKLNAMPAFVAPGKRELDDEAEIRALLEEAVPVAEPGDAACQAYYDAHPERFRSPDLLEVSHILIAVDASKPGGGVDAARRATDVIAEIAIAPGKFEALARDVSACPSGANGGRLGQLTRDRLVPEFADVLSLLSVGEVCAEPVITQFGAHVVRLDARAPGETLPFAYVRDRIAGFLAEREWRKAVSRFIDGLVAVARIEGIDLGSGRAAESAR